MKPQIGGVVLVWILLRGQWRRAAVAVPAILIAVFAARVGVDPVSIVRQYAEALTFAQGGAVPPSGHTELRSWLTSLWPDFAGRLTVAAALAALLLVPAVVSSLRRGRRAKADPWETLALCGAASLLAVRHLSYDFILLWPALIAWRVPPGSARPVSRERTAAFTVLAGLLVLGLPSWSRLAVEHGAPAGFLLATEIDRILTLAVWGMLAWCACLPRRRPRWLPSQI